MEIVLKIGPQRRFCLSLNTPNDHREQLFEIRGHHLAFTIQDEIGSLRGNRIRDTG